MGDTEVILYDRGPNKLQVVKFVKEFLNIELREAKAICDASEKAPQTFRMYGSEAKEFTAALQDLGAKVEIHSQDATIVVPEIDRIKELERRIEALESRLESLEKSMHSTAQPQPSKGGAVGKVDEFEWRLDVMSYEKDGSPRWYFLDLEPKRRNETRGLIANGKYDDRIESTYFYHRFWLLSDGRILMRVSTLGDTLREVKAFATLVGYPIPDKAKKDQLAAAIVNERGGGGICVKGDQLLTSNGCVYKVLPFDFDTEVAKLKKDPSIVIPEVPSVGDKVDKATFKLIKIFFNDIKGHPVPSKEAMLAFFDKAVENYKLKYGK